MNSTATPPLVSVVVRTMGRPTLARALESIRRQAYRPLEVVLVEAAGTQVAHPPLPGIAVRTVCAGALDRPRAANAGLEAARGAFITFLDEDDEIAPSHIAHLAAVAVASGKPVAYSQTQLVDASGVAGRVFGGPFDRAALLRSNYLSIAAVLFSRAFVDAGLRFDESLSTFEDWDFWLQLSSRTDFAFSGAATAIYHAEAGGSSAGAGANLDRDKALAQRERLMRKWLRAAR